MLAKSFVLSKEKTLNSAHERTALAGEVAGGFTFEGGLKKITRTNAYAESQNFLESFS